MELYILEIIIYQSRTEYWKKWFLTMISYWELRFASLSWKLVLFLKCLFVCVEVLRHSQTNGVMSSAVSLPNHTFTGQDWSSKRLTSIVHILSPETDNCLLNCTNMFFFHHMTSRQGCNRVMGATEWTGTTMGLSAVADSKSFLSPLEIRLIVQEKSLRKHAYSNM